MRARVQWIVAVVAVLAAGVTAALVVTLMQDDGDWPGRGHVMTSSQGLGHGHGDFGGASLGGMHGMRVDSEYDYLVEMVAHHEEAVTAARELERSPRAEMRDLGEAIVASQTAQIDQMQRWLAEWYPDRDAQADYEPMMRDLADLSGDRLDRVFLQDMIGHHMAAVMMSQQLVVRGIAEHEQVEELAESIRDEQHAEIFQMQQWLREWFGAG